MVQSMTGILVLIASPGDASEERAAVRDALNDWNINRGRREKVALLPWLWERHAVPKMGERGQSIINSQAVEKADLVVAFFDSRLGTHTGVDVSGTAEEIRKAIDSGKPVHVYFSDEAIPRDADLGQLQALNNFKDELEKEGLLGSYGDPQDLAGQVLRAIESDIAEEAWGSEQPPVAAAATGAVLRWQHMHESEPYSDARGRLKTRSRRNDLEVTNSGDSPAEDLTFTVEPIGDTQFAFPDAPTEPVTLQPDSSMSWLLIPTPHMGATGNTVRVTAQWKESGQPKEREWSITLR